MSPKAATKDRKSRQRGTAAAEAIDPEAYYVLRVNLSGSPPLLFPFSKDLYLKVHKGQGDGLPDDRTLFVGGLPLVLADENLAALLSRYGDVERAAVHPNQQLTLSQPVRYELSPSMQISALVIFGQAKGCADALAAAAAGATIDYEVPEPDGPYGVKAWLLEHQAQFPGNEVLGAQLDEWIANYEAEEERKRKERESAAAGEGWTVVKRHKGRHGDTAVGGVAVAKAAELGAAAQKKERVAADFYRAQKREKERDRLLQLRQDFEQDKQRVQQLRAARNFKPT